MGRGRGEDTKIRGGQWIKGRELTETLFSCLEELKAAACVSAFLQGEVKSVRDSKLPVSRRYSPGQLKSQP